MWASIPLNDQVSVTLPPVYHIIHDTWPPDEQLVFHMLTSTRSEVSQGQPQVCGRRRARRSGRRRGRRSRRRRQPQHILMLCNASTPPPPSSSSSSSSLSESSSSREEVGTLSSTAAHTAVGSFPLCSKLGKVKHAESTDSLPSSGIRLLPSSTNSCDHTPLPYFARRLFPLRAGVCQWTVTSPSLPPLKSMLTIFPTTSEQGLDNSKGKMTNQPGSKCKGLRAPPPPPSTTGNDCCKALSSALSLFDPLLFEVSSSEVSSSEW